MREEDVRRELMERLPSGAALRVVVVDPFPRTADGKPDVAALRTGDLEARVAAVWAAALGSADVDRDTNLFRLGVHSLSVIQALSRVRKEFGVTVSLRTFFERPTVAALVAAIADRSSGQPAPLDDELTRSFGAEQELAVLRPEAGAPDTWVVFVGRG